jgi:hypothetical protein
MPTTKNEIRLGEEIADFLASCPSREQLLNYRAPPQVQQRARELLHKLKNGRITAEEQKELDQFEFAETLLGLVKARLRTKKDTPK